MKQTQAVDKNISPNVKNVLVLGATGRTGRLVVRQLHEAANVTQTLYVRTPDKLLPENKNIAKVIQGDVLDTVALTAAMQGQDIVVATLNGNVLDLAKSIVIAMRESTVSRIIWLTGLGIHREVPGFNGIMLNLLLKKYPEYAEAADTIADSGVSYTLIRAPGITDGQNREYHLTQEGEKLRKNSVTKNAIAKFIVDMVIDESGLGVNSSLGISNA